MKLEKNMNILIVGLGLLGGSYAMALKRRGFSVHAITRSQSSIDYALEHELIDSGTTEIDAKLIGARRPCCLCTLSTHIHAVAER